MAAVASAQALKVFVSLVQEGFRKGVELRKYKEDPRMGCICRSVDVKLELVHCQDFIQGNLRVLNVTKVM